MPAIHAATSPELLKLRSNGQASKVYAAIIAPPVIFRARVNQVFIAWDSISQLTFDTVTLGAYTDLLPQMEIWIGTTDGACDVARLRIRKAATSSVIYFNESSDAIIMDNHYISGVLDVSPRAKHIWLNSNGDAFIDRDEAYTDQHRYWLPVPVLGTHAVAELTGDDVAINFDAYDSWCQGDSIWKHDWTALNGGSIATTTPGGRPDREKATLTIDAAGTYWIRDRVTSYTYTKVNDAYRLVYVHDATHPPYSAQVSSGFLTGSADDYFTGKITLMGDDFSAIVDRALIILFTADYFSAQPGVLGQITDRENILFMGWVRGETIQENQMDGGALELDIAGPGWWLENQESFPHGVEYSAKTALDWVEIKDLTPQKAYTDYLLYRTNLTSIIDCYPMAGTRAELQASELTAPKGSIWSQLTELFGASIEYTPHCDEYGRLFIEPHPNNTPESERGGIVTVMTITKNDRALGLQLDRVIVPQVSSVDLSGINFTGSTATSPALFSLATGHIDRAYGKPDNIENLLLESQSYANTLAGLRLARGNAEFPPFSITLVQNNRLLSIAPYQYASITIDPVDNPRGKGYSGLIIPMRKSYSYDNGAITVEYDFEVSVTADVAVDGDKPADGTSNLPELSAFPPLPPLPPLPLPTLPSAGGPRYIFMVATNGLVFTKNGNEPSPTWQLCNGAISQTALSQVKVFYGSNRAGRLYFGTTTGGLYSCLFGDQMTEAALANISQAWAFGVNDNAADAVAWLGKDFDTAVDGFYVGSSGGFSLGATVPAAVWDYGGLTNSLNKWICLYPQTLYDPLRVLRLSAAGAIESSSTITPNTATTLYTKNAGLTADFNYIRGRNSFLRSGGTAESLFSGITLADDEGIAGEPTNTTILAREDTAATPKISTDSGANWTTIATFPKTSGAYYSAIQWVSPNQWIWAAGTQALSGDAGVWITQDNTATWLNKTGNLYDLLGADFRPRYIRAWL